MRVLALIGIVLAWAGLTFWCSAGVIRRAHGRFGHRYPVAANYRGVRLPMVLGLGMVLLAFWLLFFDTRWVVDASAVTTFGERVAMVGSLTCVLLVGVYDDYRGGTARGIRRHLAELGHGRVTPGVVKLVGIVGAAAWAAIGLHAGTTRFLLGVPMMAGAANLWNLLDVRPGRAVKAFLVAAIALVGWYTRFDDFLLPAAIGSAAGLLPLDLRERGMLGDAGSNVLGFIVGLALFRLLPTWGLGVAFAVILALHAMGETVTLSKLIERTRPLRWLDQLGSVPVGPDERGDADPAGRSPGS